MQWLAQMGTWVRHCSTSCTRKMLNMMLSQSGINQSSASPLMYQGPIHRACTQLPVAVGLFN